MTTLLLVRHGRTAANADGLLAGWTPRVHLDETGRGQAAAVAARLLAVPVAAVVTSPLERCRETAAALLAGRDGTPEHVDDRLGEVRYGDWTGRPLKELAEEPLWRVVQAHPSAATFPGAGAESMAAMATRAVAAVRDWNERLGADATWVAVSHGDVIKAVVADALGLHLDHFQRIQVDPASLTVVRYTELRPFLVRLNDVGGAVDGLAAPAGGGGAPGDAVVGGGAGTASTGGTAPEP